MINQAEAECLVEAGKRLGADDSADSFDGLDGRLESIVHEMAHAACIPPIYRGIDESTVSKSIEHYINYILILRRTKDLHEIRALAVEFEWYRLRNVNIDEQHVFDCALINMRMSRRWSEQQLRAYRRKPITIQRVQMVDEWLGLVHPYVKE